MQPYTALHVCKKNAFSKKLKKFLEDNSNNSIETAHSINQAIKKISKNKIDLIISSFEINHEDGLDFLLELKELQNNTPFIMYAKPGNESIAVNALNLGADGYILNTGDFDVMITNLFHEIKIVMEKKDTIKNLRKLKNYQKKIIKEMKQTNSELERFTYIASHDLQEPLRMITSYLQLIEKRYKNKLDSDANEFIDYAVDGAERMKQLIDDLLVYSRTGRNCSTPTLLNSSKVLEDVEQNMKLKIDKNNVKITHDKLPSLVMSKSDLTQLFQNLIENAIKYNDKSVPEIHISSKMKGQKIMFAVTDNGIGIDPAYYGKLFQLFSRLHGKDEYKGSGIGLASCKKIVDKYDGEIWVDSQQGKGSTFYFTINETELKK